MNLDLNFEKQCFPTNKFLLQEKFFFRVYKLKKKVMYLMHTSSQGNTIIGDLSCCINDKGSHIVRTKTESKIRELYSPIDIIYDTVKHCKIKSNWFFSTKKHLVYRSTYNKDKVKTKIKQIMPINATIVPITIHKKIQFRYNFDTQNLVTFEDNLKYKGNMPFVAYCNFEAPGPIDCSK